MDAKQLRSLGDETFTKKEPLNTFHQEIAENFYPERADFTLKRQLGYDFASSLTTSYPLLCRREMGDSMEAMLRPYGKNYAHMRPADGSNVGNEEKRWLQWAEGTQRRAMYDRVTQFTRAMKEADHDFVTFGQPVISIELNDERSALLYRTWHLRDVCWRENAKGEICSVWRRWKPYAMDLVALFPGGKCHPKVIDKASKKPFEEINVMHMVVEANLYTGEMKGYEGPRQGKKRWSLYFDCDNGHLIEAIPIQGKHYVIPRWQTVAGSQYAFSPATIAALPEGRLLQAMAYTILEAGEKIANPPMVGTIDAVRSDVAIFAGGLTWVDREYDERFGAAIRALTQDARGMPITLEMQQASREVLKRCCYADKLRPFLPTEDKEMTAFQAGQIVAQYIRDALPLFAPMESEYNGGVWEESFGVLQRGGAFGSPMDMPEKLRGTDIEFHFESPLHDAIERQKVTAWQEMSQIIAAALSIDPTAAAIVDGPQALRDVLEVVAPATWVNSDVKVKEIRAAQAAAAENAAMLESMKVGSEAVANLSSANRDDAQADAQVPA